MELVEDNGGFWFHCTLSRGRRGGEKNEGGGERRGGREGERERGR